MSAVSHIPSDKASSLDRGLSLSEILPLAVAFGLALLPYQVSKEENIQNINEFATLCLA